MNNFWKKHGPNVLKYIGSIFIIGFCFTSIYFFNIQDALKDQYGEVHGVAGSIVKLASYFEDRFYDFRMSKTLDPDYQDKKVVLAEIDDETLQSVGRWPWTRAVWGPIMSKLKHFGAKVVAYDVTFSEPEKACGESNPDKALLDAILDFQSIEGNTAIMSYKLEDYSDEKVTFTEIPDALYDVIVNSKDDEMTKPHVKFVNKDNFPIDILHGQTPFAFIGAQEDPDGIIRKYPLVNSVDPDGLFVPSLSLKAYTALTGDDVVLENISGVSELVTKNGRLRLNLRGETKVRWIGGVGSYPRVQIKKLLAAPNDDQEMRNLLDGTIAFIGSTAFGAHDLRHTPVDAKLPGVFFHMNMVSMLLDGKFFKPQDQSIKWSWIILFVGSILMLIIGHFGHAVIDILFMIGYCLVAFFLDVKYLLPKGYDISLFFALLALIGTYSWSTFISFYYANKDKAFLKNAFGSYISPELIDEMYESGEEPQLGGDSGFKTAFFTDIQSFSTFSEKLSATQLVELLNEYLTVMTDILLDEKGTLDKYEGDAIIAFFGAPMPLPDHVTRACRVAARMQKALLTLRKKWTAEGDKWPEIVHNMRMRIGINSGEMVTGNMGSTQRMNYTMMGDSVNLAARLEEAAKQYGIFTQVSEASMKECEDIFEWRELDTIRVVGKSEPITTFELIGMKGECSEIEVTLRDKYMNALKLYQSKQWDEALAAFEDSAQWEDKRFPDLTHKTNPSKVYIERCKEFKENPPPEDWDGVYTLTSK